VAAGVEARGVGRAQSAGAGGNFSSLSPHACDPFPFLFPRKRECFHFLHALSFPVPDLLGDAILACGRPKNIC
jgi:hypothetical protein